MALNPSSHERLLAKLDEIEVKHGAKNKQLAADLRELRKQIDAALRKQRMSEVASLSLKLATLIKFLWDQLPPH